MREDQIKAAIADLPWQKFESFATELVSRELYPGLNPTSRTHDLGEDARTEPTMVFEHHGLSVSLAVSKTATWHKLRKDCLRCRQTGRHVDTMVFVTAGNPRTDKTESWRQCVEHEFGWDLEVRPLRWLAPVASRPDHESLVDDYLGIPPPEGDFIQNIEAEFSRHTDRVLRQISLEIPGLPYPLTRDEIARVEDQLLRGRPVVLVGEAGTGKSGVGACLARSARERGQVVLLLDARRVKPITNEAGLRQYLGLNGPVVSAVARVGRHSECLVIVDQLDDIVGHPSRQTLVETVIELDTLEGVKVVVISRQREAHEAQIIEQLLDEGFAELTSFPLSADRATRVLAELGISSPSSELVGLGRNLLNLELIGTINQEQPDFPFSSLTEEVDLWERYIDVLVKREAVGSSIHRAEQIVAEAVDLARDGLMNDDRIFHLDIAVPRHHQRLISWGIIVCGGGRVCRFRHEKLQDFLYAWGAVQHRAMPSDVLEEINIHRTRNVFTWMDRLYSRRGPDTHKQFLKEMFDVQ